MIYVTGDTHGQHDFAKLKTFTKENKISRNDYLIIAGDFGGVWNKQTLAEDLKPYKDLPFTVVFADGNHENFDLLDSFPVDIWNGGKIHRIADNIIHLMRGEIYKIEGNKIFVFGGATSADKDYRTTGVSWWEKELPSYTDYDNAITNLQKCNFEVDYIITHSCDERTLYYSALRNTTKAQAVFPENKMLSNFEEMVKYKHWYFGHYHIDANVTEKKTALMNQIIKLGDEVKTEE